MVVDILSHYRILEKLGAGGMGEVYRAEDTVLGREVALKLLPEEFTADAERLARFEREAMILASLNHPHIAQIYSFERIDDQQFLVLELVEGDTLAERLDNGPIPHKEALTIARQIAQALEAAHERGIVHRDLKPANIKITPQGQAKVLDFGISKPITPTTATDLTHAPTVPYPDTREGVVFGTPAYMSPEQARGQEVDKRSDIWAFGVVLWEMVTGKRLFEGPTDSDTLVAVLQTEPEWEALPPETSRPIQRTLRRCLERDLDSRLHDIADARIEIEEAIESPEGPRPIPTTPTPVWRWALLGLAVLLALAGIWVFKPSPEPVPPLVVRSEVRLPEGERLTHSFRHGLALSPDGSQLAFVSGIPAGTWFPERVQLYLRNLDDRKARLLPGTEASTQPVFSPDGRWLAFIALTEDNRVLLRKIPVAGGEPETICECSATFGTSWGPNDTIVFSTGEGGLQLVSALGGLPQELTEPTEDSEEYSHRLPHFLPKGNVLLYSSFPTAFQDTATILAYSLATGETTKLIDDGMDARYVQSGHLVFARRGDLLAAPFDPARLEVLSPAVPILEGVRHSLFEDNNFVDTGAAQFTVSTSGLLAFAEGSVSPESKRVVEMVDRAGHATELAIEKKAYRGARVSADGRFVLLDTSYPPWATWLFDRERGSLTRQTFEPSFWAIWGPGSDEFTHVSQHSKVPGIYIKKVGSGPGLGHRLVAGQELTAGSWSPDGTKLAAIRFGEGDYTDIWIVGQDGTTEPFLITEFPEGNPEFSPDGRWLMYTSLESGRWEVFVRPFPGPGRAIQVSVSGGVSPCWSRDGSEIFYRTNDDKFYSVAVHETSGTLTATRPEELFEGAYFSSAPIRSYSITPDDRFLLIPWDTKEEEEALIEITMPDRIQLVQNWFTELEQKVPTDR